MGCGLPNKKIKIYSTNIEKSTASRLLSKYSQNTRISLANFTLHNKTNNDVYSEYKILYKVGSGAFGKVYKVEELKTGIIRAMKIIKKSDIQYEYEEDSIGNNGQLSDKNEFLDEIKILKSLDHPNIIKLIDYFIYNNYIYIILEYFPYGDLCDEISSWKIYSEEKACHIIYQLLLGLNYLHSNRIIHRDLKPENIVLIKNDKIVNKKSHQEKFSLNNENIFSYNDNCTSNKFPVNIHLPKSNPNQKYLNESINNDGTLNPKTNCHDNSNINNSSLNIYNSRIGSETNLIKTHLKNLNNSNSSITVKIIDFGSGKALESRKIMHSINGTPNYLAPEILDSDYNEKVDIWSCGVIFYFMLVGYLPFKGKTVLELIQAIKRGKYEMNNNDWKNISTDVKHLVRCMLTYCPKKRISASEALNHCIFKKIQKNIHSTNDLKILKKALENMRRINMITKLREATFSYLIHYFTTHKEIAKLNSAFTSIDKNKDGKISFEELKAGCEFICGENLSDIEISMLMNLIDYDKNGFIEYNEFIKVFTDTKLLSDEIKLRTAFDNFDLNKDGKLCRNEILNIFSGDVENVFLKVSNSYDKSPQTGRVRINFNFDCADKVKNKEEGIDFIQFREIMLKYLEKNESAEEDCILNPSNFKNFLEDSAYNSNCSSDNKLNFKSFSNDKRLKKDSRETSKKKNNLKSNKNDVLKKKKTRSKSDDSVILSTKKLIDCSVKNNKHNSNNTIIQLKEEIDFFKNPQQAINLPNKSEIKSEGVNVKFSENVFIKKIDNCFLQHPKSSNSRLTKYNSCQNLIKNKQNIWTLTPKDFDFLSNFYSKTFQLDENKLELKTENTFYFKKIKSNNIEKFNLLDFNKDN